MKWNSLVISKSHRLIVKTLFNMPFSVTLILLSTFLATVLMFATAQTVIFGYINPINQGKYVQGPPADLATILIFNFIVKDINMDKLQAYLSEVSDPNSPNYGKYLDAAQVNELTNNSAGQAIVKGFLSQKGVKIDSTSPSGQKITASATVVIWQSLLSASFYVYSQPEDPSVGTLIRTPQFSVPETVASQLSLVTDTVDFPVAISRGPGIRKHLVTKEAVH